MLVWVQTHPGNHEKKLPFVKSTWGQRVNKLLMFSTVQNDSIPTIGLNVSEGRSHLAAKSQNAWRYIYKHHFDDADWFMKVRGLPECPAIHLQTPLVHEGIWLARMPGATSTNTTLMTLTGS